MSKAFIREDDAHQQGDLLPERAIPPHPNLVTAEGLAQIDDAVKHLKEQHNEVRTAGDTVSTAKQKPSWSLPHESSNLSQSTSEFWTPMLATHTLPFAMPTPPHRPDRCASLGLVGTIRLRPRLR